MRYTYEAEFQFSAEDSAWYAEFRGFDGSAYADGATLEEAVSNAAAVLKLTICHYLDHGVPLPEPAFHTPPLSIVSVEVDERDIALSRCMTVSQAAEELDVTPGRVSQLLSAGQLEAFTYGTTRMVTIASVNARKANKPPAHRPRKTAIQNGHYSWSSDHFIKTARQRKDDT